MRKINLIVIHCSATDIDHNIDDIDQWHKLRGFKREIPTNAENKTNKHIGYHYVIDKNGNVFKGREEEEKGAHVKNYNSNSLGVCLLGHSKFTENQFNSTRSLISSLLEKHSLEKIHVLPHCLLDHNKTCPNFNINEKILEGIE